MAYEEGPGREVGERLFWKIAPGMGIKRVKGLPLMAW
jgi:hypothetical protein